MAKSKGAKAAKMLTEVELELMTVLWSLGEGTVAEVLERLSPDRELAYTSVSTIIRILEQKGVLKARKEGRGHIYSPVLKKAAYEARTVQHVVDKVFGGTPIALVKQLLETMDATDEELAELRALVNRAGEKR
jgi:predicted transcriptional regulator